MAWQLFAMVVATTSKTGWAAIRMHDSHNYHKCQFAANRHNRLAREYINIKLLIWIISYLRWGIWKYILPTGYICAQDSFHTRRG